MHDLFRKFARQSAANLGSSWAFIVALVVIAVWAISGPIFHFSDTWQLVINTGTTIVTFLMVFLIQNTQNRDATAIHLKLDELLRAIKAARTGMVNLQELTDDELARLQKEFVALSKTHAGEITTEVSEEAVEPAQNGVPPAVSPKAAKTARPAQR